MIRSLNGWNDWRPGPVEGVLERRLIELGAPLTARGRNSRHSCASIAPVVPLKEGYT